MAIFIGAKFYLALDQPGESEENQVFSKTTSTPTQPPNLPNINEITEHQSPYYDKIELDYGYSQLTHEGQQQLYNAMQIVIYTADKEENEDGRYALEKINLQNISLNEADIRITLEAFSNDHPQIFWLANIFGYYFDDSYSTVQLYSEYSAREIDSVQLELDEVIIEAIAAVPENTSEFDRELIMHDFLINRCEYAEEVKKTSDEKTAFSIYGALIKGRAVCEGYAKAIQYLLSCVGIESNTVNGKSDNELHKWNTVSIDGEWYFLDTTWNDNKDFPVYDYFNVDTEILLTDHTIADPFTEMSEEEICDYADSADFFNLNVQECSSMENNFYNKKATQYFGGDQQSVAALTEGLYRAAEVQSEFFFIKLDEGLPLKETENSLFHDEPYIFFSALSSVNEQLSGYSLAENISMFSNEPQGTIQVFLSYA